MQGVKKGGAEIGPKEKLAMLMSLHAKLRELEKFINYKDNLGLGKPNAVALRYPMPFEQCHVYIDDESFVRGVIALAKRHMKLLQNEILKIADNDTV